LAAPLTSPHSTPVFRGTLIENLCIRPSNLRNISNQTFPVLRRLFFSVFNLDVNPLYYSVTKVSEPYLSFTLIFFNQDYIKAFLFSNSLLSLISVNWIGRSIITKNNIKNYKQSYHTRRICLLMKKIQFCMNVENSFFSVFLFPSIYLSKKVLPMKSTRVEKYWSAAKKAPFHFTRRTRPVLDRFHDSGRQSWAIAMCSI